jgi:hypothetical protein
MPDPLVSRISTIADVVVDDEPDATSRVHVVPTVTDPDVPRTADELASYHFSSAGTVPVTARTQMEAVY